MSTLLVDARPLDHPTARQRGIGRYVTGLLTGLRDIGAPAIALYGTDAEAEVLEATVPGLAMQRWSAQVVRGHAAEGTWYLATQLMLHPIPLDPIPRCISDARLPVAAVMYDVIPYRYPETYFADPNARRQAELRAPLARTTDILLAISDFAATTAAEELAFPLDRIATIGAGVERRFAPSTDDPRARCCRVLPGDVGRYVVSVAGGDERKNTEGLLRAWTDVDGTLGDGIQLVVVGAHTPEVLQRWQAWAADAGVADRVVFTGGVDDDELVALLQGAVLAVMPSLEEGFGLPVLEAVACGVPAIASNVSSLPEVLDEPAACFDPHDPRAIADAIVMAVTDDAHRSMLLAAGRCAVERWTWSNTATATINALETMGPRWPHRPRRPAQRLAIAGVFTGASADESASNDHIGSAHDGFVATLPSSGHDDRASNDPVGSAHDGFVATPASNDPIRSANDGVVEALRASGHDVTALVDNGATDEPTHATAGRLPVRAVGRFVKPWDFDHIVAVLGAAPQHLATSQMARTVPCHLWVHDAAMVGVQYGANLQALEIARSAIVHSDAAADRMRHAADQPCPILVLEPEVAVGEAAEALAAWLDDVDDLDPTTIRHATPPVTSPDS